MKLTETPGPQATLMLVGSPVLVNNGMKNSTTTGRSVVTWGPGVSLSNETAPNRVVGARSSEA
eukprot:scaffold104998_cov24-Attheya_sp.AAC.1